MSDDEIIQALQAKVKVAKPFDHPYWVNVPPAYPVVDERTLRREEANLGFSLPSLLQRIYREVGNGGPGIPPGLMGIGCAGSPRRDPPTTENRGREEDCAAMHFDCGNDQPEYWPQGMLMFCEWGCTMWSCVLCQPPHAVFFYDGNESIELDVQQDPPKEFPLDAVKVADLSLACWMKEADTVGTWFERAVRDQPVGPELKKLAR